MNTEAPNMGDSSLPSIELNVPIPSRSVWAELLKKMKVGDSFSCTVGQAASARVQALKIGITVESRTIKPNQVRVWRTK